MSITLDQAIRNALINLPESGFSLASIGEAAYPDREFRSRQGAAFAAARLVRIMCERGLVAADLDGYG